MSQIISDDAAVVAGLVLQTLRRRSLAEIVIPRQARGTCRVWVVVPGFVIPAGKAVSLFQPAAVFVTGRLLGLVNIHDHGGEKRWLRTSQVIGAVGVEHCPVMRD